jgi:hypothetical protein
MKSYNYIFFLLEQKHILCVLYELKALKGWLFNYELSDYSKSLLEHFWICWSIYWSSFWEHFWSRQKEEGEDTET